jgi:hypothetical protein
VHDIMKVKSLPHLVSCISYAFGVSGFLVRIVSVLLHFVYVCTFFFGFCRFLATLLEVNFRRFSILFFAVLLLFLLMTC